MGANNSSDGVHTDPRIYIKNKENGSTRLQYHGVCYQQGKPASPSGTPLIKDITHNSLTLHWTSPPGFHVRDILAYRVEIYNIQERRWKVVTSTCQGTSYDVKNLAPDTEYRFRVSAENAYGRSRPSPITPAVRTRMIEEVLRDEKELGKPSNKKLVRRHSHHIKLESGVETLLNKTESQPNFSRVGSLPLRRNSYTRSSLPLQRRSVASVLPGSRRESFREYRRSIEESSIQCDDDSASGSLKLHRISTSTEEDSCNRSTSSTSMTSIHEESEAGECRLSPVIPIPEEDDFLLCKLPMDEDSWELTGPWSLTGNSDSVDNGTLKWEGCDNQKNLSDSWDTTLKCDTVPVFDNSSSNSEILSAPYSDDTKLAWCSNSRTENTDYQSQNNYNMCNGDSPIWKSQGQQDNYHNNKNVLDLRSLRQVLNSEDIMVKTLNSDNNGNYPMLDCNRRRYCGSIEEEEEDNSLDLVSTI